MGKRVRVAIVGGGCAGVTAAFELTRPEHRGKYEVILYQMGWRLGGKGASGRGPADRIEEHGLHLWMGFYENAFRLLRECYSELGRDPGTTRFADWRDAFYPDPNVGVVEKAAHGWLPWIAHFPPEGGTPGDPLSRHNPFSISAYLARIAALVRTLFQAIGARDVRRSEGGPSAFGDPLGSDGGPVATAERLLRAGQLASVAALLEGAALLETLVRAVAGAETLVLRLIEALRANAQVQIEQLTRDDVEARRLWEVMDLSLATMRGIVRFGLVTDPRGFDAIDDYDCRDWLRINGASERSLDSAFLRGIYDLVFAYEDGDHTRPRIAAGQALRGALRMFFSYRGSLFWKMRAGMGDVVFAPFYEVLGRRGVRFEFFHRLENVKLADQSSLAAGERPYVEELQFDVQAEVRGGGAYHPLINVRGARCWPSTPDLSQLVDGERHAAEEWDFESFWDRRRASERRLRVVEDFDFVVLAVGLGAIPYVCREIVDTDPRWRAMVENVKTVPTQAFQLWMNVGIEDLGWSGPPVNVTAFVKPFDTWADMRQLVAEESWPTHPRAVAYFCSVLGGFSEIGDRSDVRYPMAARECVRSGAIEFLNRDVRHLWPRAMRTDGGFRWEILACATEESAEEGLVAQESRFDSQFWTANVNPSDRYALALPGTLRHRISPLDNTYDNLTIAGDWTDSGFNEGCVEAAVMSGRLAAHALSHQPPLEDIVGYDHP